VLWQVHLHNERISEDMLYMGAAFVGLLIGCIRSANHYNVVISGRHLLPIAIRTRFLPTVLMLFPDYCPYRKSYRGIWQKSVETILWHSVRVRATFVHVLGKVRKHMKKTDFPSHRM
jgi:hypothetical protein